MGTLSGWLERHTGLVFITLGGTHMRGIFLDSDHSALTYVTAKTGSWGRVSGLCIKWRRPGRSVSGGPRVGARALTDEHISSQVSCVFRRVDRSPDESFPKVTL